MFQLTYYKNNQSKSIWRDLIPCWYSYNNHCFINGTSKVTIHKTDVMKTNVKTIHWLYSELFILIQIQILSLFLRYLKWINLKWMSMYIVDFRSRMIFSLVVLIGVSWMMEIISFPLGGLEYIWIPTDIANIVTGIFIIIFRKLIQPKRVDENETAAIHWSIRTAHSLQMSIIQTWI